MLKKISFRVALLLYIGFFIPFQLFGIPVYNIGIEPSLLLVLLFVFSSLMCLMQKKFIFKKFDTIEILSLWFIIYVFLEILIKELDSALSVKSYIEFSSLIVMILFFIFTKRLLEKKNILWKLSQYMYYGMIVLALFGIWQAIATNFLHINFLTDWSWASGLNPSISGWGGQKGGMGNFIRTLSFAHEPSHFAQFILGIMGFIILIISDKFSFPGCNRKINLFFACCMMFAFLTSLSLVGFFGLFIILSCYVLFLRRRLITIANVLKVAVACMLIMISMRFSFGNAFYEKTRTIKSVFIENNREVNAVNLSTVNQSVHLGTAINTILAHPFFGVGIGMYPLAFDLYRPACAENFYKLNVLDACSLLLRMLAETGLVCTFIFLSFIVVIFFKAHKSLTYYKKYIHNNYYLLFYAIIISAFGYVCCYLLRMGGYHSIQFWLLLAIISSMPKNISSTFMPPQHILPEV